MKTCQHCSQELKPLARFCGRCGKATGFDLPALKESAEKTPEQKTDPSQKRKGLAYFTFALFAATLVFIVVFIVISFLLAQSLAALFFIIAGLTFLVYFKEKSKHLHSLVKVKSGGRCQKCGSVLHEHERYCEQCGANILGK